MPMTQRRIAITPPDGEALARYTVRMKPKDAVMQHLLLRTIPGALKSLGILVVLLVAEWVVHMLVSVVLAGLLQTTLAIPWWFFLVVTLAYALAAGARHTLRFVRARKDAVNTAALTPAQDFAFYDGGFLYCDQSDIVRIEWKQVRLALETPGGLVLWAPDCCVPLAIPPRYFCEEYPALRETLVRVLGPRFWRLRRLGREHAPQYTPPYDRVTVLVPSGEAVSEMRVTLDSGDLTDINKLWLRQIREKDQRGVFGVILFSLCFVFWLVAWLLLRQSAMLGLGLISLGLLVFYLGYVIIDSLSRGRRLLVNGSDYKQPVGYTFYQSGVLVVYENGISMLTYRDFAILFEDKEGLAMFLSEDALLFIPARYMKTPAGVAVSHFFKSSLLTRRPPAETASRRRRKKGRPQRPRRGELDLLD